MNEEKKKQKELDRKIKKINRSLTYLPKSYQNIIDVLAIQKEEHVYFAGNNLYKKIYMFKPASLGNMRAAFIKTLTDKFDNRIRFTMCTRNKDGKLSTYMFMTVNFYEDSYYEVRKQIRIFEEDVISKICVWLGITISPCTIENALTYIHMNFTGEMKKMDPDSFFDKKNVFKEKYLIDNCKNGRFYFFGNQGFAYIGKDYPKTTDGATDFIKSHPGAFYTVVDLQKYSDDELHVYDYELKNRYSLNGYRKYNKEINMTYLFSWLCEEKENSKKTDSVMEFYDSKGIQLMPAVGREAGVFMSSCSLGLIEFRSMQNSSTEVISGFLL